MPILRLNAQPGGIVLHGSPAPALPSLLRAAARAAGPVIILVHGFKYDPMSDRHSPHDTIFGLTTHTRRPSQSSWMRPLGFAPDVPNAGLAVAFGWPARGSLWQAARSARSAGLQLAHMIRAIRARLPHKAVHVITHSLGSEAVFGALHALRATDIQRIIALTGASYASRAALALATDAGQSAEVINVTSRENDLFDLAFERMIPPPVRGDRAMGAGLMAPNVVTLQLDCQNTLVGLRRFGAQIAPSRTRCCHWSSYTRPGTLEFYAHAMRHPEAVPLEALRAALPQVQAQRWSRFFVPIRLRTALPSGQKAAS